MLIGALEKNKLQEVIDIQMFKIIIIIIVTLQHTKRRDVRGKMIAIVLRVCWRYTPAA